MTADDYLSLLRARAAARQRTIVYPEGVEPRVLDAVTEVVASGLTGVTLIGDEDMISSGLLERGGDPARVTMVDPTSPELIIRTRSHLAARRVGKGDTSERLDGLARDPLTQAATMVALGEADGAVAGCVRTTADVVRAALDCIGLAQGKTTLSSSFYMVFGRGNTSGQNVLTFTDAGVVPEPTPAQLAEIAASAVGARARLVGDTPRVAFLSYSTRRSSDGPPVQRVRDAFERFQSSYPEVAADGELQVDAALSAEVAARKAPGSSIGGMANVLVFPDLSAANIGYKLVQYLGGAVALGPVLQGLARPYNDLSRGAVPSDIVAVSCITSLLAE